MQDIERRVRAAMEAERRTAERKRQAAVRAQEKAAASLDKASEKVRELCNEAAARAATQQPVPKALERRVEREHTAALRAMRAAITATNEVAEHRAAVEALDEAEFERRLRLAERIEQAAQRAGIRPIGRGAAQAVLLVAGKPLRTTEITRQAIQTGLVRTTKNANPKQTISAYLVRDTDRFVKIEPGVYDLASRQARQAVA